MHILYSFKKKNMPYAYPLDWPKMPYPASTGFFFVTMVNYNNYQCRCSGETIPSLITNQIPKETTKGVVKCGMCMHV
jgi:hypothetical protein